jgi:hypothetical protein
MYQGYLRETLAPKVREKLAEAKLEGREAATAELSAEFKQWWSVREHQIHRNARAYALYKGSVTQIRRQQIAEGAEQEEEALTTRIATVMAEQIVVTHHHNEVEKSIWRHACNPDSPLYMGSKLLEGTSFYENLLPKLEAETEVAQTRLDAELREQEQRAQDAAGSVEREYAARDAAASSANEQEFEPVSSGVYAPPACRLPPVIQEFPEEEEARELAIEDLPGKAWWRSLQNSLMG